MAQLVDDSPDISAEALALPMLYCGYRKAAPLASEPTSRITMITATTSSGVDASARLRPVLATSVWPA